MVEERGVSPADGIDPFHGQIYGRARKRFNARNHAPWWDCSDLEAACKSENERLF